MLAHREDGPLINCRLPELAAHLCGALNVLQATPGKYFCIHLEIWPIPSTFEDSMAHSLRVLTRPLADVSAPKHTAILARFHFVICGLFYTYQSVIGKC